MGQPVPKRIKDMNPSFGEERITTLLVDGSNILELSSLGDRRVSSDGREVGGIFQFFLQLKLMLQKGNFRYVYVFWDGDNSGYYRYLMNESYKSNRDKNYVVEEGLSDYMKEYNRRLKAMQDHIFKRHRKEPSDERKRHKDIFYQQRRVIMECLEELFIRQCVCDKVEADDLIGYYVMHKKPNERIVIMSNDRDLTQLIADDVIVYVQSLKQFVTRYNHTLLMGYSHENVLLKKIICGDSSDSIKGIKGVGESTLIKNFPQIKSRKVELSEIMQCARDLNERRVAEKKKPLKWADNIVNCVTDGPQGKRVYEINEKIIDLSHPIMTDESVELMKSMMYKPLDPEGRSLDNLYKTIVEAGVEELSE
ncbi:MAG: hypothetical protein J6Y37_07575, partial [Paludibacteraceae bacterium]|nr:hypothetical protein [Paludibacteraceae bacterium]